MANFVAAISRASTSGVNLAKAFFEPSGLFCRELVSSPKPCQRRLFRRTVQIPDKSVDLDGVHIVKFLQSHLDLSLIGLHIYDEYQGVVLLNLLHGALSVQRVNDNFMVIETRFMGN
jgi:hypothetical protein